MRLSRFEQPWCNTASAKSSCRVWFPCRSLKESPQKLKLFFSPVEDGGQGHDATELFGSKTPPEEDLKEFIDETPTEDISVRT